MTTPPTCKPVEISGNGIGERIVFAVSIAPAFRPCQFCLSLQHDSVFADFDVTAEGRVVMRRISFDGFGCCEKPFVAMDAADSCKLIAAVNRGAVENSEVADLLSRYFLKNASTIGHDALAQHGLVQAS